MKNKLHIILFSALLSPSVYALDLSIPEEETIHPWAVSEQEQPKKVKLLDYGYGSNGLGQAGQQNGMTFSKGNLGSFNLKGQQKGFNMGLGL